MKAIDDEPRTTADHFVVLDGYVPVIDLTTARAGSDTDRSAIAATIDTTCRGSGFLVVTGHGVDPGLIERMHDVTLAFFSLPTEVKQRYQVTPGDPTIRGFYNTDSYFGASDDTETAPDLCQMFTMSRTGEPGRASALTLGDYYEQWTAPNRWPEELPELRSVWLEYYAVLEELSTDLMRLFAIALGLDEYFFDDKIDDHLTNMAANFYPPVEAEPLPNQYRRGPHSDFGTLTVLYQDDTGGLEVLRRETGDWLGVPVVADSFVVNLGDLMEVWTNDRWRSTKHRVRVPPSDKRSIARVSIPFFHQPNWNALIECLPSCLGAGEEPVHSPVTSGTYLMRKIQMAYE